jgi:hypothetical protein
MATQNGRRIRAAMWTSVALGIVACSAPPASQTNDSNVDESALAILFPQMYSAYDGQHDFKIPAIVTGVKKVKWTAADPDMVDLEPGADGSSVMITVRKSGTTTIRAQSGSLAGSAPLTITEATPDDWQSGSARYNDGVIIMHGQHGEGGGGGMGPNQQAACTNCHGDGSKMDVQHTPMQTAGYSDDDLVNIFTKGEKPQGVPQRIMPFDKWHQIHQWAMPEDAVKGVVVYLRSLEPKSQGVTDWGGHGPGGGGHDGGGGHGGSGSGGGSGS